MTCYLTAVLGFVAFDVPQLFILFHYGKLLTSSPDPEAVAAIVKAAAKGSDGEHQESTKCRPRPDTKAGGDQGKEEEKEEEKEEGRGQEQGEVLATHIQLSRSSTYSLREGLEAQGSGRNETRQNHGEVGGELDTRTRSKKVDITGTDAQFPAGGLENKETRQIYLTALELYALSFVNFTSGFSGIGGKLLLTMQNEVIYGLSTDQSFLYAALELTLFAITRFAMPLAVKYMNFDVGIYFCASLFFDASICK